MMHLSELQSTSMTPENVPQHIGYIHTYTEMFSPHLSFSYRLKNRKSPSRK